MKRAAVSLGILSFILFGQASCDSEDQIEYIESIAFAKEVALPDAAKVNEEFSINLVVVGSSGCSEFSRYETTSMADTTTFELYQRREKDLACTQAIIDITATIEFSFQTAGIKYLLFNKGTNFLLLDSIQIEN